MPVGAWQLIYQHILSHRGLTTPPSVFDRRSNSGYMSAKRVDGWVYKIDPEFPAGGAPCVEGVHAFLGGFANIPSKKLPGVTQMVLETYTRTEIRDDYLDYFPGLECLKIASSVPPKLPPGLKQLCLSGYTCDVFSGEWPCPSLEILALEPAILAENSTLSGLPSVLRRLTRLHTLWLPTVDANENLMDAIRGMQNLSDLCLRRAKGNMPRVKRLSVGALDSLPPCLERLEFTGAWLQLPDAALPANLVELDLRGCSNPPWGGRLGQVVEGLPSLRTLGFAMPTASDVRDGRVTGEEFQFLRNRVLKHLMLSRLSPGSVDLLQPTVRAEIVTASCLERARPDFYVPDFYNSGSVIQLLEKINHDDLKTLRVLPPFPVIVFEGLTAALARIHIRRSGACPTLEVPYSCFEVDRWYNVNSLNFGSGRRCVVKVRLEPKNHVDYPLQVKLLKESAEDLDNVDFECSRWQDRVKRSV